MTNQERLSLRCRGSCLTLGLRDLVRKQPALNSQRQPKTNLYRSNVHFLATRSSTTQSNDKTTSHLIAFHYTRIRPSPTHSLPLSLSHLTVLTLLGLFEFFAFESIVLVVQATQYCMIREDGQPRWVIIIPGDMLSARDGHAVAIASENDLTCKLGLI